jgi:septal ring factor EnvC (AmiA/AmiB activator)
MNKTYITLIAVIVSLIVASPAVADYTGSNRYCKQDRENIIDHRLNRQSHRIQRGIDQASLTHKETKKLKKKHRKIRRLSREFQADGYLSLKEFRRLTRKLDRLSNLIREYKHNDLDRYVIYHDKYSQHKRMDRYW